MTKHEFHIALLLLALISAGVLGYQLANSGFDNRKDVWSNALLNSNPGNCDLDIKIDIQPPALSGDKASQKLSAVKDTRGDRYRYSEIPGFFYVDEAGLNIPGASHFQSDYHAGGSKSTELSQANGSYLNSDAHRNRYHLYLADHHLSEREEPCILLKPC